MGISISYILSQNYIFWTRNMLSWLHSQIPVTLQPCSLLTKKQEYAMTICTVHVHDFFRAKARLEPDKSWKDVLDSRKNRQEECLGVASVITFACSHISRSFLEMTLFDSYVHGNANIWPGFAQTLAANESSRTS